MTNSRRKNAVILCIAIAAICALTTACGVRGVSADPGVWGYDCKVTYDALGGVVNAREVRETYYLPNSYVFAPAGSSNMLVAPVRDGYILAGWYRNKADAQKDSAEDYLFDGADRWDFSLDRVQEDTTLYARWLPRGKVDYVDADTGDIVFTKNITGDSPIQALSEAVLKLSMPADKTLYGYFSDAACTVPYDFSAYSHVEPQPTEEMLYAALAEQFPAYFERIEYVAPEEEADETEDTSWLFLNKLGYQLTPAGLEALDEIRAAKDALVEDAVQAYLVNTAGKVVYMKFMDGNYVLVSSKNDLKVGSAYGFFDADAADRPIDGYVFVSDVDLSGVKLAMPESFSGTVEGNGHTISNLTVSITSRKVDKDTEKRAGLALSMNGAVFNDLTFENAVISLEANSGIKVTAGLLAADAENVTLNNCHLTGLTIKTGRGDDGKARYTVGDLFGTAKGCTLNDCTGGEITAEALHPDRLNLSLSTLPELPAEGETAADAAVKPAP